MLHGEYGAQPQTVPPACRKSRISRRKGQCQYINFLKSSQTSTNPPIQALFLPEASDYIGSSASETVFLAKSVQESEFVVGLQDEARRSKLSINVGIHEPAEGGNKVKNTLIWIDERGDIVQRYQKLHLFDVEIKGGPILKESQYVAFPFLFPFSSSHSL